MVIIEQAILHILDFAGGEPVLSGQELPLEQGTLEFLTKHIEKTVRSQDAGAGTFYDNSEFKGLLDKYRQGELDFVGFSRQIAEMLYQVLSRCQDVEGADFFLCRIRVDDVPELALLKCTGNRGYVHQVNVTEEGTVATEVLGSTGLLPGPGRAMEEFAYIDWESGAVRVKGKKYSLDGNQVFVWQELFLECAKAPSPKEAIKEITKAVKKVAEAYCQDETERATAVKQYIAENLPPDGNLDLRDVGEAVFQDNPAMQEDYQQEIELAGFKEPVRVDKEATLKKMRKHRLTTDTGIELVIPTEFFENTEFLEFYKDEEGFMSITLKNIQNIVNR